MKATKDFRTTARIDDRLFMILTVAVSVAAAALQVGALASSWPDVVAAPMVATSTPEPSNAVAAASLGETGGAGRQGAPG